MTTRTPVFTVGLKAITTVEDSAKFMVSTDNLQKQVHRHVCEILTDCSFCSWTLL